MKNMLLSSSETDAKVFPVILVIEGVAMAALVGYISPTPLESFAGRALNCGISVGLAILAWGCFRLFEPRRYSESWALARLAGIPCIWLLLLYAVAAWIQYNHAAFVGEMEKVLSLLNRL